VNNITKHSEVRGTITVRETGAETCAVDVEGECRVSLRGIGGIIENIVVDGIRKAYETLPDVVREWREYKAKVAAGEIAPIDAPVFPVKNRGTVKRTSSASTLGGSSFHSAREVPLEDAYAEDAEDAPSTAKMAGSKTRVSMFACCASKPRVGELDC